MPTLTPRPPLKLRGAIPYWDQQRTFSSFRENVSLFHSISLFWYYMTDEGKVRKYAYAKEDKSIIDFALANKVLVSMVVTNLPDGEEASWDSERVARVLENPEKRAIHIGEILRTLESGGFDGVTIDYEAVSQDQRNTFSVFVAELSTSLHKRGKFLGVALHPKVGDVSDKRYDFQEWVSLAQSADELYIMGYGEHWDGGSPGPIASYGWVERIVQYALDMRIPVDRFFLGIPLYGYDWKEESDEEARGLTYVDVQKLVERWRAEVEWDAGARSPHFHYEQGGRGHEVWFENAQSVREKVELAERAGFAGVTFWRLGGEDPALWSLFPRSSR